MGNLGAKLGHFFETHVEKIVLAVAGVLGLVLIWFYVLFSPNGVEFNNETYSPKAIDAYLVAEFANPLLNRLAGLADDTSIHIGPWDEALGPDEAIREGINGDHVLTKGFLGLFEGPLRHVSSAFYPPLPRHGSGETPEKREYALPVIDEVSDVLVGHIRAAAYFPLGELSDENPYETGQHEPNDLDLVTVQGTFNVTLLRDRFYDSFASEDVPEPWRDETFAEPVFAAVNLQRQQQAEDGAWGAWTDVPRLAIEYRDELMHVITKAEELPPGGIRIKALELNDEQIRTALLQPVAYDIASAHEDWFPPSLHDEFLDMREQEIKRAKREKRQAEKDARTSNRTNSREARRGQGGQNAFAGGGGGGAEGGLYGGGGYGGAEGGNRRTRSSRSRGGNSALEGGGGTGQGRTRGANRTGRGGRGAESENYYGMLGVTEGRGALRNQPTVDDVYAKLDELMLSPFQEFSDIDEVTFWAHDDRLEPGGTYRYRVRIGVLNPVAGTGNVRDADLSRADDVILWSPFSDETSRIDVPQRLRFFARNYKPATEQVTVVVAKFDMGYWNMESFLVKPGERIGREMEVEEEEDPLLAGMDRETARMMQMEARMYQSSTFGLNLKPQTIDYTTDAVLVGAARVDGWAPGAHLRAQIAHDMLYTTDGVLLERAPIASANWTRDTASSYSRINKLKGEPREDFRPFGASPAKRGRTGRGGRGDRGSPYGDYGMGEY